MPRSYLTPEWLAEIDLLLLGQTAGRRTCGRTYRGARTWAHAGHCAEYRTRTRAYARAAHHPITGGGTASSHTGQHDTREQVPEGNVCCERQRLVRLVVRRPRRNIATHGDVFTTRHKLGIIGYDRHNLSGARYAPREILQNDGSFHAYLCSHSGGGEFTATGIRITR